MKKLLLGISTILFIVISFATVFSTQYFLNEGESTVFNGKTIRLEGVSSSSTVVVSVGGTAKAINLNESKTFDSIEVKVVSIYYNPQENQVSSATLEVSQSTTQVNKTCSDSDAGLDYYTKGTVSVCTFTDTGGSCGGLLDVCNGVILTEGYCENNESKSIKYNCPYGCVDGACLRTPNKTCSDSDKGIDYFIKGCVSVCTYTDQTAGCGLACDSCVDNVLTEGYCEGIESKTVKYTCPYGCKDGACLTQITTTIPESDWHYVIVHKDQEPGWYCINITTQSRLKFEFKKVNPDYARCLWAVIDYDGPYMPAENCAPKSWGCYNSGGTLTPYNCWNFAGCTADGGKLYRLCSSSQSSFVVDLDEGAKVACAYATVWPEDCPAKNCWQARITETSEPPTPLPSDLNIKITSPVNGQTVSGTVTVKATAKGSNKLGEMYFGVQKEGENIGVMYPFKNCTEGGGCTSGGTCTYTKECQHDWDASKYTGGVILTVLVTDDKGNKATDTIKVNIKTTTPIEINILQPTDGQRVSGTTSVVISASGPNELTNMTLSIGQTFTTAYGGGGGGVVFYLKNCVDSVACPSGGTGCTYYKKCQYDWNTATYDGTILLTSNIGDVKGNIATDTVKVYVVNYQSCYEQCKSNDYRYGTCKTSCDNEEVNIGIDGCPQECETCPAGQVCPPCKTSTCCCASKKTCPYECCENDPDYIDKNCPMVTCPICKPDEVCPPCIQPKCIYHQCVWYPQEEFILNFKAGWNMFSFPVDIHSYLTATSQPVSEMTVEKAITGKIAEAVTEAEEIPIERRCPSPDHVWHYSNGKYIDVLKDPNSIVNGWGYWVKMDYDCIVETTGNKITIDDFPELEAGWNQIGAPSEAVNFYSVIGNCNLLSGPWWFNAESKKYEKAQVLRSGEGYFVKVKDRCSLGSEMPPLPPEELSIISKASKIS